MILDAHQHFLFPSRVSYPWLEGELLEPLQKDFTPNDLHPELEKSGVDKTILVQTRSSLEETKEFLTLARDTPFVAGVVGWVNLTDPDLNAVLVDLLEGAGGQYLVGVRHQVHDESDPMWLLRKDVQRGLETLSARGLSFDFLTRARELPACLETARAFPELTFVLDHAAKPDLKMGMLEDWEKSLEPFTVLPNVWVKLSGLVTEAHWKAWTPPQIIPYLKGCLELFGAERCMFGSDWPVCLLAAHYGQTLELVLSALKGYDTSAKTLVLGDSAARAYRLRERGLLP